MCHCDQSPSTSSSTSNSASSTSSSIRELYDITHDMTRTFHLLPSPTSSTFYWISFVWDPATQSGTFLHFPSHLMTPLLDTVPSSATTTNLPPDGILVSSLLPRLELQELIVPDDSPPGSSLSGGSGHIRGTVTHQPSIFTLETIDFPRGRIHRPCRLPNGPIPIDDNHRLVHPPLTVEDLGDLQPESPVSDGSVGYDTKAGSSGSSVESYGPTPSVVKELVRSLPGRKDTRDTEKTLVDGGSEAEASGTSEGTDQVLPQREFLEGLVRVEEEEEEERRRRRVEEEKREVDEKVSSLLGRQVRIRGVEGRSDEMVVRTRRRLGEAFGRSDEVVVRLRIGEAFGRAPRKLETREEVAKREWEA